MGGGRKTHHIPLLLLLIEQFTRLPHGHTDKRILAPLLLMLLALIAAAAAGEHLERLHSGACAHCLAVVLSSSSTTATTVYLLVSLYSPLLIKVFVRVGLFVAA